MSIGASPCAHGSARHRPLLASWSLATFILLGHAALPDAGFVLCAQEPAEARITDQPREEVPQLPETEVVAPPGSFPAEPLPGDSVISPNRMPTAASETGSSITVIDSAEIEAISPRGGQTTVAEVLRGRLGVDVVRSGNPGGITSVFLRGANSQQTKVLLDGIPLNDPSNASRLFDFSTLTLDNVERIEVLRGPQSMIYGSDAIGGVVNIITRRGEGPLSVRASGYGGSFDTGQTALNVSGGDDRRYYSVTGSYFSTGGVSAANRPPLNVEHDGFQLGSVNGRLGRNLGTSWNVDYVFRYANGVAQIDDEDFVFLGGTGLPIDNVTRKNLTKTFANRVQLSNWLVDGLIQQRVGLNLVDYRRDDIGSPQVFVPRFDGQTREIDYFASAQLTETNVLSAGANYLAEEASTGGLFGVPFAAQNIKGIFVQDAIELGNFFGTAGVRWDEASRAGPAQTYRVTGLYRVPAIGGDLHGTIGTGFRQPALAENVVGFGGNPNLLPERSKGWDAGWRQSLLGGTIVADATYFRNDFTDLIVFNPFTPPFGQLENVGRARASGVELSLLTYLTEDSFVDVAYTYDRTLNEDPTSPFVGLDLFRRPRDKVSLSLTKLWPEYAANATLQLLYVGDRIDRGIGGMATTNPDYLLLNLAANCQLTDHVGAMLRLDNITNEQYEEVFGFGTLGFGMYGGINVVY